MNKGLLWLNVLHLILTDAMDNDAVSEEHFHLLGKQYDKLIDDALACIELYPRFVQ